MDIKALDAGLETGDMESVLQMLEEERQKAEAERNQAIETLGLALVQMRDEAVRSRQQSGIEEIWLEDAEMYEGVDDANRAEEGVNRVRKPINAEGGTSAGIKGDKKSTVFLNIAAKYADAGAARVSDMMMPVDDRPWEFKAGPVAEITGLEEKYVPFQAALQIEGPELQDNQKQRDAIQSIAERRAKKAQAQVDDWLTACDWHGEVRKMIDDSARIGSGVMKGPVPVLNKIYKWIDGKSIVVERINPVSKRISAWDLYPDPACGENIHNGAYIWERERYWTKKMLAEYRSPEAIKNGWLPNQIEECLKEGPKYSDDSNKFRTVSEAEDYEVWHGYCTLEREDLEAIGVDVGEEEVFIPVMVVVCNERVIKVAANPDDTGTFPYDIYPWSQREGMPWGKGLVRQVRTPQRIVNAACRRMMDNAGASSGVMTFMARNGIDTNNGKGWIMNGNPTFLVEDGVDLGRVLRTVEIPSRQSELLNIINFAMRMAEEVTGLPQLLQGQQGSAPETVGGMTILNNNANGVLRRLARQFDSRVTEPHIKRYNNWLQTYSDDPEIHGDWQIDARGSSALVERDIQNQAIGMMAQFINDPEFKVNKERWFAEWSKSQRLDPKRFQYTELEFRKIQENQQPPPPPPQVMVAQIREEGTDKRHQREMQIRLMELVDNKEISLADMKAALLKLVTEDRRERDIVAQQTATKERYGTSVDLPG